MRPVLFSLTLAGHEMAVHSYGVLAALGITIGTVLIFREGRRHGLDSKRLWDLCFWTLAAGFGGSRLLYVVLHAGEFADACAGGAAAGHRLWGCTAAFRVWEGGLVFYGGGIASLLTVAWFCRREGWSFLRLGDVLAPGIALGHALGRVGCLAAGCCFGKACTLPWAVTFGPGSVAYQELAAEGALAGGRTPPLHPTQIYEAAANLGIFALLMIVGRRAPPRTSRPGAVILTYGAAYALLRFVMEIFRGDPARRFVATWRAAPLARLLGLPEGQPLFLSTSQLASLAIAAAVGIALWRRYRRPVPAAGGA